MKLAVTLEGVHARYLGGKTVSAGYDTASTAAPILVTRALAMLGGRHGRLPERHSD